MLKRKLTLEELITLVKGVTKGVTDKQLARTINCNPSTITRECRNLVLHGILYKESDKYFKSVKGISIEEYVERRDNFTKPKNQRKFLLETIESYLSKTKPITTESLYQKYATLFIRETTIDSALKVLVEQERVVRVSPGKLLLAKTQKPKVVTTKGPHKVLIVSCKGKILSEIVLPNDYISIKVEDRNGE